ncbi:hypothetical protein GcM1_215005 [Golovinomyces cichoracearum]|uniref:Uncharacterized protein n=1 Tax=Golovinomyces cichoracearum TaxID=62708 RepID=A0A420ITP2_9PEZI|nr:hypothetical protein GcM1_215005 [Golovinomyces cichoracearum]
MTKWNLLSLKTIDRQNPDKSLQKCLEILFWELKLIQRCLSRGFRPEKCLRDKLINACNDIEACAYACLKPFTSLKGLCSDPRSSIISFTRIRKASAPSSSDQREMFSLSNLEKNPSDDLILQNDLEAIIDCAETSDDELNEQIEKTKIFITSYCQVNGYEVVSKLNN